MNTSLANSIDTFVQTGKERKKLLGLTRSVIRMLKLTDTWSMDWWNSCKYVQVFETRLRPGNVVIAENRRFERWTSLTRANASLVKFNVEMEFFLAPRQRVLFTAMYRMRVYIARERERKRDTICGISTWSQRSMLYRVCGGARIEAKFPWNAKSIYPLCVPLLLAIGCPF